MACFDFLAPSPTDPLDPGTIIFFPRCITPDGDFVYGQSFTGVDVYTWPGLVYSSSPYSTTGDIVLDDAGNVYHQDATSATTYSYYKNGSLLTSITLAANLSGGGLAWADGYLWTTASTDSGTDSGSLYRIDPTTGTTTAVHTVTGGRLSVRPYAATDGALWYTGQGALTGTVYRYDGSAASTSLGVVGHFIPRPSGVMLARKNVAPIVWVDIAPDLSSGAPSCDPTVAAGATPPPNESFANPSLTDVCFIDDTSTRDIYRAEVVAAVGGWRIGIGWQI